MRCTTALTMNPTNACRSATVRHKTARLAVVALRCRDVVASQVTTVKSVVAAVAKVTHY